MLYARLLAPAQIGHFAIAVAAATGIVVVADGGLQLFLTRAIARKETGPGAGSSVLLVVLPANVLLVWLVAMAGLAVLSSIWGLSIAPNTLLLVLELALSLVLYQAGLTLYQGLGWFRGRAALLVWNGVATMVATVAALTVERSVSAAVYATAVAYFAVGVAALVPVLRRYGLVRVPVSDVRHWFRCARGLWLNACLGYVTSSADVLLAALVLPIGVVGLYQVFKKLALVALSPLSVVLPLVYAHLAPADRSSRSSFVRRLEIASAGAIALGLLIAAPYLRAIIGALFGTIYAHHVPILLALVAIGAVQFSHNLLGYVCAAAGEFYRPLWMNVCVAGSGTVLALGLGSEMGVYGFLVGLAVGNMLGLVLGLAFTSRLLDRRARLAALVAAASVLAATTIAYALFWVPLMLGAVIGAASAAAGAAIVGRLLGRPGWLARKTSPIAARTS